MKINTPDGKTVEFKEEREITFPLGLVGYASLKRFFLSDYIGKYGLKWMISLDEADKIFLVADPYKYSDDYEFNLSIEDKNMLEVESIFSTQIFAIVTVPEDCSEISLNLSAPIVINPEKKIGKQVVLNSKKYTHRFYLLK